MESPKYKNVVHVKLYQGEHVSESLRYMFRVISVKGI